MVDSKMQKMHVNLKSDRSNKEDMHDASQKKEAAVVRREGRVGVTTGSHNLFYSSILRVQNEHPLT